MCREQGTYITVILIDSYFISLIVFKNEYFVIRDLTVHATFDASLIAVADLVLKQSIMSLSLGRSQLVRAAI